MNRWQRLKTLWTLDIIVISIATFVVALYPSRDFHAANTHYADAALNILTGAHFAINFFGRWEQTRGKIRRAQPRG